MKENKLFFQTNFNFLRTTGSNTMQIGVSDYALPVIRIPSNNKYVGIGGGSNFVPSSIVNKKQKKQKSFRITIIISLSYPRQILTQRRRACVVCN